VTNGDDRIGVTYVVEATLAGVRRHVVDLLTHLDTRRFRLALICSRRREDACFPDNLAVLRARGVRIHEVDMAREIRPGVDLRALARTVALLRAERPAIVHGHSAKGGFLARVAGRLAGRHIRTLYTPNGLPTYLAPAYRRLERFAGRLTDRLIAVSPSERRMIETQRLVRPEKIALIPAGIPVADPPPRRRGHLQARLGLGPGALLVGTAGRVCPQKDPLTFLAAAERICAAAPAAHVVWMGDGELLDACRARLRQLAHADRIHLIGFVADAPALVADLDVLVQTSRYESFGYAVAEAMLAGVPVVATAVEGTVDLVREGDTGCLVPVGAPGAVAEATLGLLGNTARRQAMGEAAARRIRAEFTLERMVRATEDLYCAAA
jgi:glycosyltransferase involved in cell wall biosynthesis